MTDTTMFKLREYPGAEWLKTIHEHPEIYESDRQRLYQYISMVDDNDGSVEVTYQQKLFNGHPMGRFYSTNGFLCSQYQWNKIRSALFGESEYDVDIVNCHPEILKQLYCRLQNNPNACPVLANYVNNREKVIEEIEISPGAIQRYNETNSDNATKKDFVKSLFTILIYGGTKNTWMDTFNISEDEFNLKNYYDSYYNELNTIKQCICNSDDIRIKQLVANIRTEFQKEKKYCSDANVLSLLLQNEEQIIVHKAMSHFRKYRNQFKITSYNYDGFQVRHSSASKSDEIAAALEAIINSIPKSEYDVRFIIKPFREPLQHYQLDKPYLLYIAPFIAIPTHDSFADIMKAYVDKKLLMNNGSYYKYEDGIWKERKTMKSVENLLDPLRAELKKILLKRGAPLAVVKFIGSKTSISAAIDLMLASVCNDYIDFDSHVHLLNAPNGTFNLNTFELQPHNPDDYLTKCVRYNIDTDLLANPDRIDLTVFDLIHQWFDNTKDSKESTRWFLQNIARCLHGDNEQKALVLLGKSSRNGKSTFIQFLKQTLGNYVGSLPMAYFTKIDDQPEAPKPFLFNARNCRIVEVGEATTGEKLKFNEREFKMWTGKDTHYVRDLYSKANSVVEFVPQSTLMLVCNENISFTNESAAVINRLKYVTFNNWFGTKKDKTWNMETNPKCRPLDATFKRRLYNCGESFLHLLLAYYKAPDFPEPATITVNQGECIDEIDTVRAWTEKYLVADTTPFNLKTDKFLIDKFKGLTGKPRCITLEFLYKCYCKDEVDIKPISELNFNKRISLIFPNNYDPRQTTTIFGKKKRFISNFRYNAFDNDMADMFD